MRFYHSTTDEDARSILKTGFRDATGTYMYTMSFTGVFISNVPLDENEGSKGNTVLSVDIPIAQLKEYELIQQPPMGYREWCVPAYVLNRGRIVLIDEEKALGLSAARFKPQKRRGKRRK
jgi:hypothetical protein